MYSLDVFVLQGKVVLIRVDLNVPVENNIILDDTRIKSALPTVMQCISSGAKVVLLSHFGQPGGRVDCKLSLRFIVAHLVKYIPDVSITFSTLQDLALNIGKMQSSEILVAENLRFHPGEEKNDEKFTCDIANLGDVYVNEAFSVSHREHASIIGLPKLLPSAIGMSFLNEISILKKILDIPEKPFSLIIAGSKARTKGSVVEGLIDSVDNIIIGGVLANSILLKRGYSIGKSVYLDKVFDDERLILPQDVITASDSHSATVHVCTVDAIPKDESIFDIGPASLLQIKNILRKSKTVVWCGTLGVHECPPFDNGTNTIMRFISSKMDLWSVIGGGDTVSSSDANNGFTHISTGGGAFLMWLRDRTLVGLEALKSVY